MSEIKGLIDSNDACNAYYRYMRAARRDGDKMPTRHHSDPQARMLVRELNNELDKLQFGYQAQAAVHSNEWCVRCGGELGEHKRLVKSSYPSLGGRIDFYVCGECSA